MRSNYNYSLTSRWHCILPVVSKDLVQRNYAILKSVLLMFAVKSAIGLSPLPGLASRSLRCLLRNGGWQP
jgi:hypothetical protein